MSWLRPVVREGFPGRRPASSRGWHALAVAAWACSSTPSHAQTRSIQRRFPAWSIRTSREHATQLLAPVFGNPRQSLQFHSQVRRSTRSATAYWRIFRTVVSPAVFEPRLRTANRIANVVQHVPARAGSRKRDQRPDCAVRGASDPWNQRSHAAGSANHHGLADEAGEDQQRRAISQRRMAGLSEFRNLVRELKRPGLSAPASANRTSPINGGSTTRPVRSARQRHGSRQCVVRERIEHDRVIARRIETSRRWFIVLIGLLTLVGIGLIAWSLSKQQAPHLELGARPFTWRPRSTYPGPGVGGCAYLCSSRYASGKCRKFRRARNCSKRPMP